MAKGRKTGGRKAGAPNKATADVRFLFGKLARGHVDEMGRWLSHLGEHDPARACEVFIRMLPYVMSKPRRRRAEVSSVSNWEIRLNVEERQTQ